MPSKPIVDGLRSGELLLLDGAIGSELHRRGVDVLKSAGDGLYAWSATANLDAPEVVQQIHEDYLRAGADIITTNNFWTSPFRLGKIGLAERWRDYAQAGAEAALRARSALKPEAYVAGVEVCAEAGLPIFLATRELYPDGRMQSGESLSDLAHALRGRDVAAVLLHCSTPEAISAGLPLLREAYAGPIGAYPNIGYHPTARVFLQNQPYPPARLAEFAQEWKDMGAQIIGGCCGTGPEHIAAMRTVVQGPLPP